MWDYTQISVPWAEPHVFCVPLCCSPPPCRASAELCAAVPAFLSLLEMGNTYFELGICSYFRLLMPLLRKFGHMLLLSPKIPFSLLVSAHCSLASRASPLSPFLALVLQP